jgi:hypothetical protein
MISLSGGLSAFRPMSFEPELYGTMIFDTEREVREYDARYADPGISTSEDFRTWIIVGFEME